MKEALLTRLSLEDVMDLLGVQFIPGTPGQLERLRKWIERLVEKRGNTFVLENRRGLLEQWKRHMVLKNWDCC
jgi:hypothetical protein